MNLHGQIMNIQADGATLDWANTREAYLYGHRDARHAAAALALPLDAMRAVLAALLKLPEAERQLNLLRKGIGTATPSAAWLQAHELLLETDGSRLQHAHSVTGTRVLRIPSGEAGDDLLFTLDPSLSSLSDHEVYEKALETVKRFNQEDARNEGACDDGRSVMENIQDELAAMGIVPATVLAAKFEWDDDYGGHGQDDADAPRGRSLAK